jgi:hypothetical protein
MSAPDVKAVAAAAKYKRAQMIKSIKGGEAKRIKANRPVVSLPKISWGKK